MKNGIMNNLIKIMIILVLGLALGFSIPSTASAKRSKRGEIRYTGKHGHNMRVSTARSEVWVVIGTIYEIQGNTIVMDGESFSVGSAEIKDQLGVSVAPKELYPGLKVQMFLKSGSVRTVVIENFFRNRVITDPLEVQRKRDRQLERLGR